MADAPLPLPALLPNPPTQLTVPAAAGGGPQTNATTTPIGFPTWLLQSQAGPYISYLESTAAGNTPSATPVGTTPVRCYRLQYLFGVDQTRGDGKSWVNPLLYLLLVQAQKTLWSALLQQIDQLATAITNNTSEDPGYGLGLPTITGAARSLVGPPRFSGSTAEFVGNYQASFQMGLLMELCGITPPGEPGKGLHGRGNGDQHYWGGAIDIEYTRSPFIPMRQSGGNHPINIDTSSYSNIKTSLTPIASGCVAAWDNACNMVSGQPSSAVCARGLSDPMSNADVSAILGPIRETHNSIVKYFAQTPRPAADYTKAKFGMVMGTADLHNTDDSTQWTGAWRDPANGIIGFSDAVVQNLLVGPSSDNVSNIVPSALSFTSANGPYKIRWSVTTFGADLMHFDVEHTSSGGMVRPSAPDMKAYDGFVVTLVSTTQSDGKNPWFG